MVLKTAPTAEEHFVYKMQKFMVDKHGLGEETAQQLAEQYMNYIDLEDPVVQHSGPNYYAKQILMSEGIIEYKPM